jgi:hypothetical protein
LARSLRARHSGPGAVAVAVGSGRPRSSGSRSRRSRVALARLRPSVMPPTIRIWGSAAQRCLERHHDARPPQFERGSRLPSTGYARRCAGHKTGWHVPSLMARRGRRAARSTVGRHGCAHRIKRSGGGGHFLGFDQIEFGPGTDWAGPTHKRVLPCRLVSGRPARTMVQAAAVLVFLRQCHAPDRSGPWLGS